MKRHLKWTRAALDELNEIGAYIARDNSLAAIAFREYVEKIADDLTISPIGRPGRIAGTRERILTRYPNYIIVFQADNSVVTIMRVFHGARNNLH